jgi:hypothetical protein
MDVASPFDRPKQITIDGQKGYEANVLVIDFYKDDFDRRRGREGGPYDPPVEVLQQALNSLVRRLRYVTRASKVKPIDLRQRNSLVVYLNDDGSELPEDENLYRRRGGTAFQFSYSLCTADMWKDIEGLAPGFEPPIWDDLLLDADDALPHVGSAVALGAIALERFITEMLNQLASAMVKPPELWTWLMTQSDPYKLPSVNVMYDELLKLFTGHSLKEDPTLWAAMTNLKNARNNFVHGGVPSIGKSQPPLSEMETRELLAKANAVVGKVRGWMPTPLHWPPYKYADKQVQVMIMLMQPPPSAPAEEQKSPAEAGPAQGEVVPANDPDHHVPN